jgi:archaemetzincin
MNAPSEAQVHFRMVTTCIHEIGHTLGLEHCPDTSCLMTDARGTVRTVDRTTGHLCPRCRSRVGLAPRP